MTTPLSQVALPVHAHQSYGNGVQLPVLMRAGTFAVDPESWGGPWRMGDETEPGEAEARGIHAPVRALSDAGSYPVNRAGKHRTRPAMAAV
ncbi:hypothetical protein G3M53_54730, partial [Streptomyces sp. SID7982]|nr:hypothetical protein [Streptomyces sp. SID7982]